jgi:hypothetical protein
LGQLPAWHHPRCLSTSGAAPEGRNDNAQPPWPQRYKGVNRALAAVAKHILSGHGSVCGFLAISRRAADIVVGIDQGAQHVLVAGGGIGGLAARWRWCARASRSGAGAGPTDRRNRRRHPARPQRLPAFDALGVGDKARGRAVFTDYMVMHDAVDEPGRQDPHRRGLPPALRQPLCGDPPRGHPPVAAGRRAGNRPGRIPHLHARRAGRAGRCGVTVIDQNGRATTARR